MWQEVASHTSFAKVGSTTVAADGRYSVAAPGTIRTNRKWYVTTGTLQSATISERVSAVLTLFVRAGRRSATIHGGVTPSHAGEALLLQRRRGRRWVTIARPVLNPRSRFALRYGGAPRARATVRAVLRGDATNMRSVSKPVTAVLPSLGHAG